MCTPQNPNPKDELIPDERGRFHHLYQDFFYSFDGFFRSCDRQFLMKKSYLLPFPSDFFYGYNGK